jgi:hypothetical protein
MREWVNKNVYAAYIPRVYVRTYQLLNAITLSDIKIVNTPAGTEVEFEVYFDSNKMHHTSVVSGTEYWNGQKVNVPYFINYGHSNDMVFMSRIHYGGFRYMYDVYPARHFLEDMMNEFKKKLETVFANKIVILMNKVGDYKYR